MILELLTSMFLLWMLWMIVKINFPFKFSSEFKIGFYTFLWNSFPFKLLLLLVVICLCVLFINEIVLL